MARFNDLETGFEKFLAYAYGRHIITGHPIQHSVGLEGGGGTGKEVAIHSALGDGAYNEQGEGAWGIVAEGAATDGTPSFISIGFNLDGFSEDVGTISPPTGVQAGDYLLVSSLSDDSAGAHPPTIPSGWSKLEEQTVVYETGTAVFTLFGKFYDSGDTTPYNFYPSPAPGLHDLTITAWRNVNSAAPVDDTSSVGMESDSPGPTAIAVPGVTTIGDDRIIVAIGEWRFANVGIPSGYTAHHDGGNSTVSSLAQATAGSSGTVNIPLTGTTTNDIGAGYLVAFKGSSGELEIAPASAVERVLYAGEVIQPSNYHYQPGTISTGDLDPIQGSNPIFPGSIYSATPNIAVKLPEGLGDDADHSKLAVILKTSCIGDYDINGNLIAIGYSVNPARVKADMLKRHGKLHRLNWPSFVHARDYYDVLLNWEAGDTTNTYTAFTGVPVSDVHGNITVNALTGAASKPTQIDGYDNYAQTKERIVAGTDGWYRVVVSGAFPTFTDGGSLELCDEDGQAWYRVHWGNGHISSMVNGVAIDDITIPYDFPATAPVTFEIGVLDGDFYFKQDGVIKNFPQGLAIAPDLDLFGRLVLYESTAAVSSQQMSGRRVDEVTQNITQVKRFEAHPAFTGPTDINTALDYVDFLTASDTQDAGKEIYFLTPEPRTHVHVFDEETNVVNQNVRAYSIDIRERPNRLWAKYRNLDLQFLDQDSVFDLRDDLFERVGRPVDPGALNFASMSASQAQRLIKYWMRRRSDNYRWCDLTGMQDSLRVLPADVVRVLSKKYRVRLSAGYNAAATTIVLRTGDAARFRLPPTPFKVTWWNKSDFGNPRNDPNREVVLVTAVAGDSLTIVRAQDGTTAVDHNIAGKTYVLGRIPKDFLVITAGRGGLANGQFVRPFKLQEYYPDDYRDDDHEPSQADEGGGPMPSPFACPPTPVLALDQQTSSGIGGFVTKIIGTVHFGLFANAQSVKIYVTKGNGSEQFTGLEITPASGTSTGTFEYLPSEPDTYTIRAEVITGGRTCGSAIAEIMIGDFILDDVTGEKIKDDVTEQFIVEG